MKCLICGRKLRSPQSRECGYGPVCYKKVFGNALYTGNQHGPFFNGKISDCELPGQISMEDYMQMVLGQ